ncbi:MAG: DUF2786 domain-containing protein [Methylobacter sp.]|nr:DUF2786 domain-containing protein [Methylobacter sp.]
MTEAELKKIALKIAKCLALANSDNAAEAETAKRQAEALMAKYNLTSGDVAAANVHEKISKSGGKYNPPLYLCALSDVVATAFGCQAVFQPGGGWRDSVMKFIGIGIKPELASYTFDVLRRQINNDRTEYSKTLKRFKRANKIRMADLFCDAWVSRVSLQVRAFAGSPAEKEAIAAYKQQRFGSKLKTDDRTGHTPQGYRDYDALIAGRHAASDVSLHKPVQRKRGQALTHKC